MVGLQGGEQEVTGRGPLLGALALELGGARPGQQLQLQIQFTVQAAEDTVQVTW